MNYNNRVPHVVTHRIECLKVFDGLAEDEAKDKQPYRRYAHHLARACWHGARVVLRQTSPEAEGIFDFIMELHKACNGEWEVFCDRGIAQQNVDDWLEYAGMFLSSLGNYFGDGDHKVVPDVPKESLRQMATISLAASERLEIILEPMTSNQPATIGYPSSTSQSGYYLGQEFLTQRRIKTVTQLMAFEKIATENTRLHDDGTSFVDVLVASQVKNDMEFLGYAGMPDENPWTSVYVRRGDHSEEMRKICEDLNGARKNAGTQRQRSSLARLIRSFKSGDYEDFRSAQQIWVMDKAPRVEHCIGFLFGYRDPDGVRAEWQAVAGITDEKETVKMKQLVEMSAGIIRTLPWATTNENDGKGPFEPSGMSVPELSTINVLASVSSTVWEATNISIEKEGNRVGVKSMIYGNRLSLNNNPCRPCHFVHPSESEAYMGAAQKIRHISTVIHEVFGHGTGKLLAETAHDKYNFNIKQPPKSPLTGEPIQTWYKPGEDWNRVFGTLAPTVEECRAFLMAIYLLDNLEILKLFGFDENSTPSVDDMIYFAYLYFGVAGLCALRSFQAECQVWGGDHSRAEFAIFKHLLQDGEGTMFIEHDIVVGTLFVRVDRTKMLSHGKASIARLLTKIHIWRSTADVNACRPLYEALTTVEGEYERWRRIVVSKPEPKWKFVQPNTFLGDDGSVTVKEYEATNAGIIKSFFERNI